jgi:hypothetical protein
MNKHCKLGAANKIAIGCLTALILFGVLGFTVYKLSGQWLRSAGASLAVKLIESGLIQYNFPEEEQQAILAPLNELAEDIKMKQISLSQLEAIGEEFLAGTTVMSMIEMRAFQLRYIEQENLSAEAKNIAYTISERYAKGIATEQIGKTNTQINAIILEPDPDEPGRQRMTESITLNDLAKCLAHMKNAADTANIPDQSYPIDLATHIREAIEKGKQEGNAPTR